MKVRFLQIAVNESELYGLDDLGRVWVFNKSWIRIDNPSDEKKSIEDYDFTQGFATRGDYPKG